MNTTFFPQEIVTNYYKLLLKNQYISSEWMKHKGEANDPVHSASKARP